MTYHRKQINGYTISTTNGKWVNTYKHTIRKDGKVLKVFDTYSDAETYCLLDAGNTLGYIKHKIESGGALSYGELAELQSLSKYIDEGDVQLLELAGVEEGAPQKKELPLCDVCSKELYKDNEGNWVCEDDDLHNEEE